mmetsp:Transcript_16369/g.28631  ORF Transcript_16369/g.28631 Transcript_16369/m.28631 type:complete len:264 (-) Transcript_16369:382-1173(-)
MTALHVFHHIGTARRSKRLNGVKLAFFHTRRFLLPATNNGNGFPAMYSVRLNVVAVQVTNGLDWIHLAIQLDFVCFHGFLDQSTNFANAGINTTVLDSDIGGFLDSLQQRLKLGIECNRVCRINNMTVDMNAEIQLHDVVFSQHCRIPLVRRIMRGHMVQAASCWETDSRLESTRIHQRPCRLLQRFAHVKQFHTGLNDMLIHILSNLSMNFGGLPRIIVQSFVRFLSNTSLFTQLLGCGSWHLVLLDFAQRIYAVCEDGGYG